MFPDADGAAKGAKYVIDVEDNSIYTETIAFGAKTTAASGNNRYVSRRLRTTPPRAARPY